MLNSKGWILIWRDWALILEGLGHLEVATAGADVPHIWSLFETFFGKLMMMTC